MSKLKQGERCTQKFEITTKFKAENDGDPKLTAAQIKQHFEDMEKDSYGDLTITVKEIKA